MQRKQLSKKLRFEVFKRDKFTCQYCGAHPPSTVLHVDHIDPVSNGGVNDIDNLVTSCIQCNLGKGAHLLIAIPKNLKDKAHEIKEAEEQLRGFHSIIEAKRNRIEEESWDIAEELEPGSSAYGFNKANFTSIKLFIQKIGFFDCLEAAEIATSKFPNNNIKKFKYFCGVCWNKMREGKENA